MAVLGYRVVSSSTSAPVDNTFQIRLVRNTVGYVCAIVCNLPVRQRDVSATIWSPRFLHWNLVSFAGCTMSISSLFHEVKCWQECVVPNFVTSNCFIAQAYAKSIAGFLRDHLGRQWSGRDAGQQPVYIVEIGAGSAKLSYVLLKKLLALAKYLPKARDTRARTGPTHSGARTSPSDPGEDQDDHPAEVGEADMPPAASSRGGGQGSSELCFKYIITDFSHANFGFWINHPKFQELFSLGVIDFAVFDAEAAPEDASVDSPLEG
ncbi:unnamed protein product, partial [Choristocarpus tenellus]